MSELTAPWLPNARQPKDETLSEFSLLTELLQEGGKAIVALQRELPIAEQRESATETQRRASYMTADQVGRGRVGLPATAPVEFVERAHQAGDER